MKFKKLLLATALISAAGACSADVTAPELRAPAGASTNDSPTTQSTPVTPTTTTEAGEDAGIVGSVGGKGG